MLMLIAYSDVARAMRNREKEMKRRAAFFVLAGVPSRRISRTSWRA
jgi:hypothetical protein